MLQSSTGVLPGKRRQREGDELLSRWGLLQSSPGMLRLG
jgi:hypothetical protein